MQQIMFIQTGMGIDVHGQDITKAAERAVADAIHRNSMPGIRTVLPSHNLNEMKVHVKLAIPIDRDKLDVERIKNTLPYGQISVDILDGGLATTSGIYLEEQGDQNDLMYIVVAVIEVGY